MGIHDGHRERLRQQFNEFGLDTISDYGVLELLLFHALPRVDTNPIAHRLIDRFGSLEAVFSADIEELQKVQGIGENTAVLIKLLPMAAKRYSEEKNSVTSIIDSSDCAGAYMIPKFRDEHEEVFYVICLDAKQKIICCKELARGPNDSAEVSLRQLSALALMKNSVGVILAHNHTSGIAIPTTSDEILTRIIKKSLGSMGIALLDHIIVAGDDFVSMADSGML